MSELKEWRTGKRRVYWRLRWGAGVGRVLDFWHLRDALEMLRGEKEKTWAPKLYRVTIKPKGGAMNGHSEIEVVREELASLRELLADVAAALSPGNYSSESRRLIRAAIKVYLKRITVNK